MRQKPKKIDPAKQIAERVKPAPRKPNEIKKKYLPGSPGEARAKLGVTLTALKVSINVPELKATVMLDEAGNPTGEEFIEAVRNSAACTKWRRNFVTRGLLGKGSSELFTANQRRNRRSYATCNSKAA
jgi:hypothetical protein